MKMHYSHRLSSGRLSQVIGAFIAIPVLGLIVLGMLMAKTEHLFEDKYVLFTNLKKAYGLEPGAPVLISGIPVGRVENVELDASGAVEVAMEVRERYRDLIRADSTAEIVKSGFVMGQTQVEIKKGDPTKAVLMEGGRLSAVEPRDIGELIAEAKPALESIQRTLAQAEQLTKDLQGTVQVGTRVMTNVERATGELPALVDSVKLTVQSVQQGAAALPELTVSVKKTMANVDGAVGDVRSMTKKLPAILDSTREAIGNVKTSTEDIKDMTKHLRKQVPGLVRDATSALEDTNTILRGAKKTFPVSLMVKNAESKAPADPDNGLRSLRGDQVGR